MPIVDCCCEEKHEKGFFLLISRLRLEEAILVHSQKNWVALMCLVNTDGY
jgi:hypothetical protein